MPDESTVKSQVTQDKIETDEETFVKVAPDQTCTQPLIPTKEPSKEVDFDVTLEKGVVYNPSNKVGIYGKTVNIGYGCRINGSIYGRDEVELATGTGNMGPGLVYGSVNSLKDIVIQEPTKKMDDYGEGSITLIGDLGGKNIEINSPTIVKGNVVAEETLDINAMTIVEGNIYSKRGKISLSNTVTNLIVAGNYMEEEEEDGLDESSFGIHLKENVSVITPFVWLKNKKKDLDLNIEKPVRVVNSTCWDCEKSQRKLKCSHFHDGECEKFKRLTTKDKIRRKKGVILTNAWRKVNEAERFIHPKKILKQSMEKRKDEEKYQELFEADEYDEYVTLEDMAPNIEQSIEKTVIEDQTVVESEETKVFSDGEAARQYGREERKKDTRITSIKENTKRFEKSLDAQFKQEKIDKEKEEEKKKAENKCLECGREIEYEWKICPQCGSSLEADFEEKD